eukprot:COSAG02_NODE_38271_length_431_cov_0.620482_1_plen_72_part_01
MTVEMRFRNFFACTFFSFDAIPSRSSASSSLKSSTSDNDARGDSPTVAVFLHPWYERLREDLDELGVEVVDD